jgi:hypothetical protein
MGWNARMENDADGREDAEESEEEEGPRFKGDGG